MSADQIFEIIANTGNSLLFFNILWFIKGVDCPFLIFFLFVSSIYFSVKLNFINFRYLFKAFKMFFSSRNNKHEFHNENITSSRNIVFTTIGGAVDLGSMFGVASIVASTGPGTIFWLLFAGIISTSLRFVEVFCGHFFRKKIYLHGKFIAYNGGPQVYIKKAFSLIKMRSTGIFIAKLYAFNVVLSTFFSLQTNQTVDIIIKTVDELKDLRWLIALIVSVIIIFIVVKGIAVIAKFNVSVVPTMIGLYVLTTIYILYIHSDNLIPSIIFIIKDAFSFKAVNGSILLMFVHGMQRAFFCNESGLGSGAIAHASSSNKDSLKEATISIVTPIIAVMIVCLCSGLIIVVTGVYTLKVDGMSGVEFIMKAFCTIHPQMKYLVLILVPLFGLTTAISWAYYGSRSFIELFGRKNVSIYYILLFIAYFMCGMVNNFTILLNVADICGLSIAIPNIIALIILLKLVILKIRKIKSKKY